MEQQARYDNEDPLGEGAGMGATSSQPSPPALEESSPTATTTAFPNHSFCRLPPPFPPIEPRPMDIICGRGSRMTHPGNQRFRSLVLERKEIYQQSTRREDKTRITLEIVQQLLAPEPYNPQPARFLLRDNKTNIWHEVNLEYAKEKVSHALRSRPTDERRKNRSKPPKRPSRKPDISPAMENLVRGMITDQQSLLRSLIQKEVHSMNQMPV